VDTCFESSDWSTLLDGIDVVGISPGLSPIQEPTFTLLSECQKRNIAVWSEIEFFARGLYALEALAMAAEERYKPSILAVTGTNGKTTTCALTAQICERAGKHVALAGNISPAALEKLLSVITKANNFIELPEIWVLELSSFQLQFTYTLDPTAATVLNLSQDHLDWHGDMQAYAAAKARILGKNSVLVLNRDDEVVTALFADEKESRKVIQFGSDSPVDIDSFGIERDPRAGGIDWLVWAEPDEATLASELEEAQEGFIKHKRRKKLDAYEKSDELRIKRLIPADALRIRGRHNALNALAALALARAAGLGISPLLHGLREYQGEAHRVQTVAVIGDVEYIDDSKGTNVGATVAALHGLGSATGNKNIWLIVGGDGKGQDFSPLVEPITRFAKGIILIGRDAPVIEKVCAKAIEHHALERICANSLESAVEQASQQAKAGDIVLLSPACASFDMFKDYKHRARIFEQAVQDLVHQASSTSNDSLRASV
jgi:UDP-N-acetylmuramoylalanine--D-glutamate ligase